MKVSVNECYELEGDYQNQFLGVEVFPKPNYKKIQLAERSVHKVHYKDIYILEPLHYYYINFNEDISLEENQVIKIQEIFYENGLIINIDYKKNRIYLFNASQNIIYLQKNTVIGEVSFYG